MELIAESLVGHDIIGLEQYNPQYNEGDTGEVRVYMDRELSAEEIADIEAAICAEGAVLTAPIRQDARVLIVPFKVAIWPLPIIAGIIAVGGGILGWQLFKDKVTSWLAAPLGVPLWAWILGAGSAVALYFLTRRKGAAPAGKGVTQKFYIGKGK